MKIRWREPLDFSVPLLANAMIVDADPCAPVVADGTGFKRKHRLTSSQEQKEYWDYVRSSHFFTE